MDDLCVRLERDDRRRDLIRIADAACGARPISIMPASVVVLLWSMMPEQMMQIGIRLRNDLRQSPGDLKALRRQRGLHARVGYRGPIIFLLAETPPPSRSAAH